MIRRILPLANRYRRSTCGKKKHLAPLPILSVLLLITAMASPTLLRMTVTLVDDTHLTIVASIQNVIHPSGPDGKIVGIPTVTNHGSPDLQITAAAARIPALAAGTPPGAPSQRIDH